jgi:hypothetical protein
MIIFATIWTLLIGVFDVVYGGSVAAHARARAYPHTEGVIVSSAITNEAHDVHGVVVAYTYDVYGRSYRGTNYRGRDTAQSGSWAADAVRQLPVGARVPVFYDPAAPSVAVLRPGLSGDDGFFALFLLPFNVVALGLWSSVVKAARVSRPDDETGGLRVVEDQGVVRVRPDTLPPAGQALMAAAFAAFASVFVVAFGFSADPPVAVVSSALVAVGIVTGLAYLRAVARRRTGVGDLVIDTFGRTLRFPLGRKAPRESIPWSNIAGVVVEATTGGRGGVWYWVSLDVAGTGRVRLTSGFWPDQDAAGRFRDWLAERVGRRA